MPTFDVMAISFLGATSHGSSPALPGAVRVTPMRSILLVDDDAEIRLALRDFLTAERFVVHTARDGQHALHVLEKIDPPNLILLDYKMPIMDGKQFLSVLRRMPRLQTIPVVILSAATREWSGAHLEVEEVLSKPVDLEVLRTTVNRIFAEPL